MAVPYTAVVTGATVRLLITGFSSVPSHCGHTPSLYPPYAQKRTEMKKKDEIKIDAAGGERICI
jgi:hypothetical protein